MLKQQKIDRRRKTAISKKELTRLYVTKKLPTKKIAEHFNCSKSAISYWLLKYRVRLRSPSESALMFHKRKRFDIPKKELYNLFHIKKEGATKIAKKYRCKIPTVIKLLRKHNITHKFSKGKRVRIVVKTLKELYINKNLTTYEIADRYACCQTTIWKMVKKHRLKKIIPENRPSDDVLRELYTRQKLSTWAIEKKYGFPRSTVHRRLKIIGVIKNRAQAQIRYSRRKFDGTAIDKAYLIGFRLGDLRVRKVSTNSETIQINCSSTKKEQINLLYSLFNKYGRVWIHQSKKDGPTHVQALLDLSFSFLLKREIPSWVAENSTFFLAFLAGFSDAEGCFTVSETGAQYSIGNYNAKILSFIQINLLKLCRIPIRGLYRTEALKYTHYDGYPYNQDYWIISMSKKSELLKFTDILYPYVRHKDKLNAMKNCRENILKRNRYNNYKRYGKTILYHNGNRLPELALSSRPRL